MPKEIETFAICPRYHLGEGRQFIRAFLKEIIGGGGAQKDSMFVSIFHLVQAIEQTGYTAVLRPLGEILCENGICPA